MEEFLSNENVKKKIYGIIFDQGAKNSTGEKEKVKISFEDVIV